VCSRTPTAGAGRRAVVLGCRRPSEEASELTAEQGAALAGFEVLIKNAKAGDGQIDEIHKIKLWDV
jgi:hypothetical protein